jgi:LPXTG-motif cell wall-anchored protein
MGRRIARLAAVPAVGAAALFAAVLAGPSAYAYGPHGCTLSESSSVAVPGGSLTLSGSYYKPDATVTIDIHSAVDELGSVTASPAGSWTDTVTIPTNLALGEHVITASDGFGDSASVDIDLVSSTSSASSSSSSSSTLPYTGINAELGGGIGAGAIAAGGLLVLATRRRRRTAWSE